MGSNSYDLNPFKFIKICTVGQNLGHLKYMFPFPLRRMCILLLLGGCSVVTVTTSGGLLSFV